MNKPKTVDSKVLAILRECPETRYDDRQLILCYYNRYSYIDVYKRQELNRDEATILMVESNYQRSQILPSEKAYAYKMRLEAMKRQGERLSLIHI